MNALRHITAALACAATLHASDTILHSFGGQPSDGSAPQGDTTISGSVLYGMTSNGGTSDAGAIYRLNADGSGFALLQSLGPNSFPSGSLSLSGASLYGMTYGSGAGLGSVFKIATNGTGYTALHNFLGGTTDGRNPLGSLLLSGSTLYGMTNLGGAGGSGTVFSINSDGSSFSILHSFSGGSADGSLPAGSLTLVGSTLYGMTSAGGAAGGGTLFKVGVDGTGFSLLQSFSSGNPQGSLTFSGTTLYGMTKSGGSGGNGTIFKIGLDGSGFSVVHNFTGIIDDGSAPSGSLTLVGSTLYGTTQTGGVSDGGTVFQINLDGTGFGLVHSFAGGITDGISPQGSLSFSNGLLYGTTSGGGPMSNGTVFSVAVPEPGVIALLVAGALLTLLRARSSRYPAEE